MAEGQQILKYLLVKTLVEIKLAANTKLKMNLQKQIDIYSKANYNPQKIVVIVFFTSKEEARVKKLLTELNLNDKKNIVLIDARIDNKISASLAMNDILSFNDIMLN